MRVGKLKHQGTIEDLIKSQDGTGGVVENWETFCEVYCDIKPLNGNEKYVSHEKHATATHQVIIRYREGILPRMRLVARGRIFDLVAPALNINEQDKMMQLIVEEDVGHDR